MCTWRARIKTLWKYGNNIYEYIYDFFAIFRRQWRQVAEWVGWPSKWWKTIQNDWIHPGPESLGTFKDFLNSSCLAMSILLFTTSPFRSICWTHSHSAQSTSGLVTMHGHLHDNAFGIESTWASIFGHCCSLCDSVDWLNNNAPWGLVAKYFTTSPWLIGCGRLSTYVYTVIQSNRVRFSHFGVLIDHVEVFRVSFDGPGMCSWPCLATWMGCFWHLCFHSSWGMVMEGETAQIDLKTIQMPKKNSFSCASYLRQLIAADQP